MRELLTALSLLRLPITEIIGSGGGETKFTQRLRRHLNELAWHKHKFTIQKLVDGEQRESVTHEIDHVRTYGASGRIALEIEWNNKDPFFDRDLENFKRLHAEGAISVGVIITRGSSLQDGMRELVASYAAKNNIQSFAELKSRDYEPTPKQRVAVERQVSRATNPLTFAEAWTRNFVANKYGQATTHWEKLIDRVKRGVGNPCPMVLVGLPRKIVDINDEPVEMLDDASD